MPLPPHPPSFYLPNDNELTSGIYRKPTYTDIIIYKSPSHLNNHKQSAYNNLLHRVHKVALTKEEKEKKEIEQRFDSSK
jgi:hypothetical protein